MKLSDKHLITLSLLRIAVGWHFCYEGLTKVLNASWTSRYYLLESKGILAPTFIFIGSNDTLVNISNFIVIAILLLVGIALILGVLSKYLAYIGAFLVLMFWFSHPPLPNMEYAFPFEGNYFLVDKNLIEFFALVLVILLPTDTYIGVSRLVCKKSVKS